MKFLLDTHAYRWLISGDARLSGRARDVIVEPANEVYLSVASLWEATVKNKPGKLPLPDAPEIYLPRERARHRIASLSLDEPSVARLGPLPQAHRDPFDRMLICQAIEHGLTLITVDAVFPGVSGSCLFLTSYSFSDIRSNLRCRFCKVVPPISWQELS